MVSPFSFGQVVEGSDFTDRQDELKVLSQTIRSKNNVILISPRRFGKSSLVNKVLGSLNAKKDVSTVAIDLTASRSEDQFLEAFAFKVLQANSPKITWKKIRDFLRNIVPSVTIGTGDLAELMTVSFNWDQPKKTTEEILQLPQTIAFATGQHQVIAVDEFQNINRFQDPLGLQLQMRAIWQYHKDVSYCLYGSKRHMMEQIFTDDSSPFYNFGHVVRLQKIKEKYWLPFIIERFKDSGKAIPRELVTGIVEIMNCHPEYIQFLSHLVWASCSKPPVKSEHLTEGLKKLLNATSIHFLDLLDKLNNTEVKVIRAILSGEQKLTSQEVLQKFDMGTSANVVKALRNLREDDFLERVGDQYSFINPVFELWFRFKILNEKVIENFEETLKVERPGATKQKTIRHV